MGKLADNEIYCVACKHKYKAGEYELNRDRNGRARIKTVCPYGHTCYKYVSDAFYDSHFHGRRK